MGCDDMVTHSPPAKKCHRCGSTRQIDGTEILRTLYNEKLCLDCLEKWILGKFGKSKPKKEKPKKVKQGGATVIVCPADPKAPGEYGKKSNDGKCPKCGNAAIPGYGICYGGMGPYETCESEKCQWYWKKIEDVEQ